MTNPGRKGEAALLPGDVVEPLGPTEKVLVCAYKKCPFLTYQRQLVYGCFCRVMLERADAIEPYEARKARLDRIAATTPPEPLYHEYECASCRARFKARQPAMFCPVCVGDSAGIRRKARSRR